MQIRQSHDYEIKEIKNIHLKAFGEYEGAIISKLAEDILNDETAEPKRSFLAEEKGELIGHVLFTNLNIENNKQNLKSQILAPLAVLPKVMKNGIGSTLVKKGTNHLKDEGIDLIFVYGDPKYYSRFGFKPAKTFKILPAHPIPKNYEDAWMVMNLSNKKLELINSKVKCCKALDDPKFW